MSKKNKQKFETRVMTANMLVGGNVVYLVASGNWDEDIAGARLIENDDELRRLNNVAQEALVKGIIVGPYTIPIAIGSPGPNPLSKREQIRANGPTVPAGFSK